MKRTAHGLISAHSFEARYRQLIRTAESGRDNEGCVYCAQCNACAQSTFCRESERLIRCHYCVMCSLCVDCSHCRDSRSLVGCNHCVECETCTASAYLVKCVSLSQCTYCLGCVGLMGRDFCILNEQYERADYFSQVKHLLREFDLPTP